jgi:hypothetical protein
VREVYVKIFVPELIYRLCLFIALHYRKIRYGYTFMRIPLTQGQFAIVDVDDYEKLADFKWFAVKYGRCFYAERKGKSQTGKHKICNIKMHRQILNPPDGLYVDHINHNGLDNRKANLRIVTMVQNSWNARKQFGNFSSQYKGVTWSKTSRKWKAHIGFLGERIYIGCFDDEQSAARAYDAKAKELFGEFAYLNFPSCPAQNRQPP